LNSRDAVLAVPLIYFIKEDLIFVFQVFSALRMQPSAIHALLVPITLYKQIAFHCATANAKFSVWVRTSFPTIDSPITQSTLPVGNRVNLEYVTIQLGLLKKNLLLKHFFILFLKAEHFLKEGMAVSDYGCVLHIALFSCKTTKFNLIPWEIIPTESHRPVDLWRVDWTSELKIHLLNRFLYFFSWICSIQLSVFIWKLIHKLIF
jgi:hypothetical protein